MQLDPALQKEIYSDVLDERIEWADNAIDKLRPQLEEDPTGTVKGMLQHWISVRAAFRWAKQHNTLNMWEKVLSNYDISDDGYIIRSSYDAGTRL